MLLRKSIIISFLALVSMGSIQASDSVQASDSNYAVGFTFGLLGPGFKGIAKINENINAKLMLSGFNIDNEDIEFSDIDYEGDFDLGAVMATVDWYPFDNKAKKLYFAGGLALVDFNFEADAKTDRNIRFANKTLRPGDIESLTIDFEDNSVAPYIGIGWGNPISSNKRFSFQSELGLLFSLQDPDVSFTVVDPMNNVTAEDINQEIERVRDDYSGVNLYASVSVAYRF